MLLVDVSRENPRCDYCRQFVLVLDVGFWSLVKED